MLIPLRNKQQFFVYHSLNHTHLATLSTYLLHHIFSPTPRDSLFIVDLCAIHVKTMDSFILVLIL